MQYKGYLGVVEFDEDDQTFHGRVANIRDVVTFEGDSVNALRQAFRDCVDDCLEFCRSRGEEPEKPYSGKFVTRMAPRLHRLASLAALRERKSLNAWIGELVEGAVAATGPTSAARSARDGRKLRKARG